MSFSGLITGFRVFMDAYLKWVSVLLQSLSKLLFVQLRLSKLLSGKAVCCVFVQYYNLTYNFVSETTAD